MVARATGSGTISFGLVSIPIKIYTATASAAVSFHMLHKKCGQRLKMQLYCAHDKEVVPRRETVKGYEHGKGVFVQFTEAELKELEAEKNDRVDIVEFVPESTVDFIYIADTHYLGPSKGGDRAYKLLADAMKRMNRIAVGRYWTHGKEALVLLRPYRGGLAMHQVYYADEVRSMDEIDRPSDNVQFKPIEIELADRLVQQLSTPAFRADQYKDEFRERVLAAVEQKAIGIDVGLPAEPKAQVIDLFEALKRSLSASQGQQAEVARASAKAEQAAPMRQAASDTTTVLSHPTQPSLSSNAPSTQARPSRQGPSMADAVDAALKKAPPRRPKR
jgi:DNA end-binding protein Ku